MFRAFWWLIAAVVVSSAAVKPAASARRGDQLLISVNQPGDRRSSIFAQTSGKKLGEASNSGNACREAANNLSSFCSVFTLITATAKYYPLAYRFFNVSYALSARLRALNNLTFSAFSLTS